MHFLNISTVKRGLNVVCFVHFYLEMCFAPQRRALLRHLHFQKWSETVSFLHSLLGNVLRAKTACTFSTSQFPKVVRDRQFLTLLTWKCPSYKGVRFWDISKLPTSGPKLTCFVHFDFDMCFAPRRRAIFHLFWQHGPTPAAVASLLFDPQEPQIIGKHNESRLYYLSAHLHLVSPHSLSSLIFSLPFFSSPTLPTSAFPSLHIVRNLNS